MISSSSEGTGRVRDSRRFFRRVALTTVIPVAYNMLCGHSFKLGLAISTGVLLYLATKNGELSNAKPQGSFRSFLSAFADSFLATVCGSAFLLEAAADGTNIPIIAPVLHLLGYALEALFVSAMVFSSMVGEDVEKKD